MKMNANRIPREYTSHFSPDTASSMGLKGAWVTNPKVNRHSGGMYAIVPKLVVMLCAPPGVTDRLVPKSAILAVDRSPTIRTFSYNVLHIRCGKI